jgi:nucleoside-diphosphate-sugar epimerase
LVRITSDLSLLEGIPIEKVVGSLEDPEGLMHSAQGMDIVFHVAAAVTDWGPYSYFYRVNVKGTQHLLHAAITSNVKRFVFISSIAVHSFIGGQDMDENSPQLSTPFPYCRTKREAENVVMEAHKRGSIEVTIVRPGDIYGPGDRVALLKMAPMLEKGWIGHIGGGHALGSFAYVENLVDGIILAGTVKKAAGEVYIITDGIKMSWREYFDKLTAALDLQAPRWSIHPRIAYAIASLWEFLYRVLYIRSRPLLTRYVAAHLLRDFHFSIEKARRELGYQPSIQVDEAIQRTAAWYKQVVRNE